MIKKKLLKGRWYDLPVIPATLNKIKLAEDMS